MKTEANEIITISECDLIGQGQSQQCFKHPLAADLCIKIPHAANWHAQKTVKKEIDYFNRLYRTESVYQSIPKYYGEVLTSKGVGYVFDLILDYDGKISQNLETCINSQAVLRENFSQIVRALKELKKRLLQEKIVTRPLYPGNILYQRYGKNAGGRMVIIDDLGSSVLLPLEYYVDFLANIRIAKRWSGLLEAIKCSNQTALTDQLVTELSIVEH